MKSVLLLGKRGYRAKCVESRGLRVEIGAPARELPSASPEAISHRGPDQQGIFEGSEATLCAVRLKIIDLEGGNQPILSDDRDTAIVFNGEIYNHLEIRAELEGLGHRFHSNCDTETVLRAYLEWDTACFSRMRGMFAVTLWTESEKRLVLVRDRMGIKPLYYYRHGEELCFGSELKAILEHPEVPRELDLDALDTYLSLNYVTGTKTLIRGIRKVAPGHLLEWRHGKVHSEAWWKIPEGAKRRISLGAAKEGTNGSGLRRLVDGLGMAAGGVLDRYLRVDQSYYLPDDILYKTDRMSMAHSLEVRPPFLDHRIVEFAASLPERLKIRGGTQKYVLRGLMRGKLPETVLTRKKTGFDIPTHDWFRGPLRGLLRDTVTAEAIGAAGIFDGRAIETLIGDHRERRINAGYHLWGLLTLFLWMKRWKVEVLARVEVAALTTARVFATR